MNDSKLYYMASPYMHADPDVRRTRFEEALKAASVLMNRGLVVFSPIAHTHPIAIAHDLPKDWGFWKNQDETIVRKCDGLLVLMIDGWRESKGVNAEIEIAQNANIPVQYVDPAKDYLVIQ